MGARASGAGHMPRKGLSFSGLCIAYGCCLAIFTGFAYYFQWLSETMAVVLGGGIGALMCVCGIMSTQLSAKAARRSESELTSSALFGENVQAIGTFVALSLMMVCNFLFVLQGLQNYKRGEGLYTWLVFVVAFVASLLVLILAVLLRP